MNIELRNYRGTPQVFLDGKPIFYASMWGTPPKDDGYKEAHLASAFGDIGVHIFAFDIGGRHEWRPPAEKGGPIIIDFSTFEKRLQSVIDADPDARFHFRIHFEVPEWWTEYYPNECEIDSSGERRKQSFASELWREQVNSYLAQLIAKVDEIGMRDRVYAYQTGAGSSSEWVKGETSMGEACGDYSQPMRRHFRRWLRNKYSDDASSLCKAWGDTKITFDTVEVPTREEQIPEGHDTFRDPRKECKVVDYYKCLADLCAELIIDFNETVKKESKNKVLSGAFYGYLTELAWNRCFFGVDTDAEYSTVQRCGHLGLRKVLESPDVDFLVSPCSYGFRGIGGAGAPMLPTETLRNNGKLYIFEEDSRTMTAGKDHNYGRVYTAADSIAVMKRNFTDVIIRGMGIWWLGHYQDLTVVPEYKPVLSRFQEIGDFALQLGRKPQAEIAVLLDDRSFFYERDKNTLDLPLIFQQRLWGLARTGAPYDLYLADDYLDRVEKSYKFVIFLNAFMVSEERKQTIRRRLEADSATALWIYAPAYIADAGTSLEGMESLTGFRFEQCGHPWGPMINILDFEHPITRDLPQDFFWGTNSILSPVFFLNDDSADILGQVVYSLGGCKPGFAVKDMGGWKSVYSAAPNLPAPVLRGIADYAGVHLYSKEGDVLYALDELLAVHTVKGGSRTFRLPRKAEAVYDLFEKKLIAENADVFNVDLDKASSSLFFTGEKKLLDLLPENKAGR
jgi:hypothetical protein